jgi:hypothetical protein
MKVTIHAVKQNPNCVEHIELTNVSSYEVNDNEIKVKFNGEPDQIFILTNTETEKNGDWYGLSIFSTKVALNLELGG